MNSFLVKLLYPKKYIRVLIAQPDRSLRGHNIVPKSGTVTIGDKTWLITNDTPWMRTGRNVPCYVVAHDRVKPLDLYKENGVESVKRDSEKSPADIKAFVDSEAFRRLARKKSPKEIMMYLIVGAVILVGGLYMIYTKIQEQAALIAELKALIEALAE